MESAIKSIGWIGTGVMGSSMCKHLLAKGYSLSVYNRTKSKAEPLISLGANYKNPEEIATSCQAIFLMLGYPQDLEDLLFKKEILKAIPSGTYLIDHTTSSPQLASRIYSEAKLLGIHSIDAPVSGGDIGARDGKLAIMCGGDEGVFEKVKTVFSCYGTNIRYMGDAGKGQHTKMVNQIAIVNNMQGVVEALMYGHKAGLDLEEVIKTIGTGAAGSFSLNVLGPRILKRDFAPGFYVEHFVKDLHIILEESRKMNLSLPGTALITQFYQALMAQGGGRKGTQALMEVIEGMNGEKVEKKFNI